MVELNAPPMAESNFEVKISSAATEQPRPRSGLVIALPIHRADLPAISLMLLAGALLGWWVWITNQPASPLSASDPSVTVWEPLVLSLLHQKPVTLTLTLVVMLLIVAVALAVSPLRWWAYLRFVAKTGIAAQLKQFQPRSPKIDDAEAWVAAQVAWQQELQATVDQAQAEQAQRLPQPTEGAAATEASGQAGEAAAPAQSEAPQATATAAQPAAPAVQATATAAQPAAPAVQTTVQPTAPAAADGHQPAAPQAQAPAVPQPTPQQEAEQQPGAAAPAQPRPAAPAGQQASAEMTALAEESKEEALDLNDLTDIQDMLSSFADNDVISAELLALSASLNDVELAVLVQQCDTVAEQLATGSLSQV